MATKGKNLSEEQLVSLTQPEKLKIGVVVSEWNNDITSRLLDGVRETLKLNNVLEENTIVHYVPGTFELPLGAQYLFENQLVDGIICVGCVIQGDTKHFDYVCEGATNGIMQVSLRYNKPASFCVLTDHNKQQSIDRSGGIHGNKGIECTVACLKMLNLKEEIIKPKNKIGF